MATNKLECVGVVGAGAMGRGIAQVSATGGLKVLIYDAMEGAAAKGRAHIAEQLGRMVEKGRMQKAEADEALGRIEVVASLDAFAPVDCAIEAVVENIAVKHEVFRTLEGIMREDAIISSNTSSIRLASIAAACRKRDRVAGLHFFNPVPVMKLVEVIRAPETSDAVVETLIKLGKMQGRVPVVVKDGPGFLVNLGGRAYTTEALRINHEGAASPAQIDAIMRDCCGFILGPFELLDLTGLDVNFPVSQIIYEGFFHDRRLSTSPAHQAKKEAGQLGRKTGQGFYRYDKDNNKIGAESPDADTSAAPATKVYVPEADDALEELLHKAGAEVSRFDDGAMPIAIAPLGEDCTSVAARLNLDHRRIVAIDISCNTTKRITIMIAPGADQACRDAMAALLAKTGAKITAIRDCGGFVAQRIRAMVANLGCEMAQTGVASPEDIDRAMTLGLNYPQGPMALTDLMGPRVVFDILTQLQAMTGDDRYRPSQWLRRRALLGLPAGTPD